eukprot:5804918-Prymnesium_polylepis.1
MLIAMMGETFTKMSGQSFALFATNFASFVVNYRKRTAGHPLPLLNVIGLPYSFIQSARWLFRFKSGPVNVHGDGAGQLAEESLIAEAPRRSLQEQVHSAQLLQRVNGLRVEVIETPGKKQHFERAIADFCRVVDDDEDPIAGEVAEMHAELGDLRKALDTEIGELRGELRTSLDGLRQLLLDK